MEGLAPGTQLEDVEVFSPDLGWKLKPNVRTSEVTSNSHGLRGEREYAPRPAPGVRRVLCVGDSLVFGDGLTDEETMPAQLEMELDRAAPPRWEVLNLAVRGYGTDQQWLRLERLGFQYNPDIVVLGFFEEDVWRNAPSFRDYAKPYFGARRRRPRAPQCAGPFPCGGTIPAP